MHLVNWASSLAIFWLLLSGFFQPLMLAFGIISVALVVFLLARMDRVDHEVESVFIGPKLIHYCVWLMGQIVASSVQVTRLVWGARSQLEPQVGYIEMSESNKRGQVLYANSITLTPGTLCVDIIDDTITVHALQAKSLDDLRKGEMDKRILKVKGKSNK